MKEYKTTAHINSLKGEMAEIIILEKVGDNVTLFLIGSYANITPTIFTGELNNEIHFLSSQRIRNVSCSQFFFLTAPKTSVLSYLFSFYYFIYCFRKLQPFGGILFKGFTPVLRYAVIFARRPAALFGKKCSQITFGFKFAQYRINRAVRNVYGFGNVFRKFIAVHCSVFQCGEYTQFQHSLFVLNIQNRTPYDFLFTIILYSIVYCCQMFFAVFLKF